MAVDPLSLQSMPGGHLVSLRSTSKFQKRLLPRRGYYYTQKTILKIARPNARFQPLQLEPLNLMPQASSPLLSQHTATSWCSRGSKGGNIRTLIGDFARTCADHVSAHQIRCHFLGYWKGRVHPLPKALKPLPYISNSITYSLLHIVPTKSKEDVGTLGTLPNPLALPLNPRDRILNQP